MIFFTLTHIDVDLPEINDQIFNLIIAKLL